MDMSVVLLICGGAAVLLGLVFCFFGYKLARLLFPLCGLIVIEGLLYIYVYDMLRLDTFETWLFFVGSSVAVYVLLFFFKRAAGFFTGILGSAIFLLYVVSALRLQSIPYIYPACMTVCLVSGILTVSYQKAAVVVFTSLFGACVAAFAGLYTYIQGVDASYLAGGMIAALAKFLSGNAVFIAGISAGFAISGILVQLAATSSSCVLPGKPGDGGGRFKKKPMVVKKARDDVFSDDDTMADSGY
jgi:hypothetical protein